MTIVADDKSEMAPSSQRCDLQLSQCITPTDRRATPRSSEIAVEGYGNGADLVKLDSGAALPSSSLESAQCLSALPKVEESEAEETKGLPKPVGFCDRSLSRIRKNAACSWLRTSTS